MAEKADVQTSEPTVEANGKVYSFGELNETAQGNLISFRFAESEVKRLQRELALAQTAAAAYRRALAQNLPEPVGAAEVAAATE